MKLVSLYHPALKRWHEFPATSVDQWKRCGWVAKKRKAPAHVSEESEESAAVERRTAEEL